MRFRISRARLGDVDLLTSHRLKMWLDIHPEMSKAVKESRSPTRAWIRKNMSDGKLIGFIARTAKGEVAGSGCLWMRPEQPRPSNKLKETPYLMSMYTEGPYRRKGAARRIVKCALEWSRDHGYERVVLHASAQGRPLYESFGFEPGNEMRLRLNP